MIEWRRLLGYLRLPSYGGAKTAEHVISTEWERSLVAGAPSRMIKNAIFYLGRHAGLPKIFSRITMIIRMDR